MLRKTKKQIVIGNWKMHPSSLKDAERIIKNINTLTFGVKNTDVVFCPPFLYLEKVRPIVKLSKKNKLGAQDVFWENPARGGAFTGEVSALMLKNAGVNYVITGHSEKRYRSLGEGDTNAIINKKIKSILSASLSPILCVGEKARDKNHRYFNLIKNQLEKCLANVSRKLVQQVIVAYEPVWAISSTPERKDALPTDCQEMIIFIRKILSDKFGKNSASEIKILYGGSVNERDAEDFLRSGGVDGLLVGRASLDAKKFSTIVKIAENINKR